MDLTRRAFIGASAAAMLAADAAQGQPPKLRACIIGDTKQGGYGHSLHTVWAPRTDVEVVALADPDEEGRKKTSAEAHAQRTYADYREMLEKEKPDLVTIGPRWPIHHLEYFQAAAACGAHGLIEKPIATDLAEADEMVRLATDENLRWSIGFNFRMLPIIQHARRLVAEQGLIGDVLELRGRGKEDARAGCEDLLVLGVHIFDLMRFFVGSPRWCAADITVGGRPAVAADVHEATEPLGPILGDRIHAMYGFDGGIAGYFASTKNAEGNAGRWGLDIYGSKGVVSIRQNGNARVQVLHDPSWAPKKEGPAWEPLPGAPPVEAQEGPGERYQPIIDDLIAAIRETRRPAVSLEDGRDALEMVHAVYAAHLDRGRTPLPLKVRAHPLKS